MKDQTFSSKILLFGEYGIVKGAKGVAIPYHHFSGRLVKKENTQIPEELKLNDLYEYLNGSSILSKQMDLERMKVDIDQGLFFESNIPLGHGVGSSGALCASLFNEYSYDFSRKDNYKSDELKYLQDFMALMESYYHGSSSGLDCLISLIHKPVIIESRNSLKVIDLPCLGKLGHFYLYDTGIVRKTSPLVHSFLKEYESDKVFRKIVAEFIDLNDQIINTLLDEDVEHFEEEFYNISKLQFLHFKSIIPDSIVELWSTGLETKKYFMKVCGAGGGGFFLIYSVDKLNMDNRIKLQEI